jgi:hypothetical protein
MEGSAKVADVNDSPALARLHAALLVQTLLVETLQNTMSLRPYTRHVSEAKDSTLVDILIREQSEMVDLTRLYVAHQQRHAGLVFQDGHIDCEL